MQTTYTEDDLILFMYGEVSPEEKLRIQHALDTDMELFRKYHSMRLVKGCLDTYAQEPDPSSIDIILEHSQHMEHFH